MKTRTTLSIVTCCVLIAWWQFESNTSVVNTADNLSTPTEALPLAPTLSAAESNKQSIKASKENTAPNASLFSEDTALQTEPLVATISRHQEQYLPLHTLTASNTRILSMQDKQPAMVSNDNAPPVLVEAEYQRLLDEISQWQLEVGQAIQLKLNVSNLFDDPDNDLLSTRVSLNLAGATFTGSQLLTFRGTPKATAAPSLTITANDSYHSQSAEVTAHFPLPLRDRSANPQHPLEGETIYRLETTHELNGQFTLYEVVYCQAFKFIESEVYYAAANNKTHCPKEEQLKKIGNYHLEEDKLVLSSQLGYLDANQIWQVKHQYPSKRHPDTTNYLVAVHNGQRFESYTMQKQAHQMEKRLNALTGQTPFQTTMFDYLLPLPDEQYLPIEVGNYLFDHEHPNAGPNNETLDSDLNIIARADNLSCATIATWYEMDVVGGQGEYGIELISSSDRSTPEHNVECIEFISNPATGRVSLAFDAAYSPYDKFVDGEIYSYILRPKPQFAERVEELKINMHYLAPR